LLHVHDFLLMDGYYAYVWGAWGLTLVTMAALAVTASRHHRRALAEAVREQELPAPRRAAVRELS
jgi:heme exporter protein CcmD